jgi:protoporphyrin/coproporphyrin ferrochelatase
MVSHIMRTNLSGLPVARDDLATGYDAILVVGFGGPECREDVLPFLENVTTGRNIPRERLLEVAEHYYHFDGVSPINAQVRELIAALRIELDGHGMSLPIFWGNRNWHPLLGDTLAEMTRGGVKNALAVVLAAYSSYSSCRQYREDIARAQSAAGPSAPHVDKVRVYYNHPDFIAANADRIRDAWGRFASERRDSVHVAFTAHSIPIAMARNCDYERQLSAACRLVAEELGIPQERWALVYQSKSGRPGDPWLEPDILQYLRDLNARGAESVVIHPIGFLSDHMEVLFDLDEEARLLCQGLGLEMVRARTVGTHPLFVSLLRELIAERIGFLPEPVRRAAGDDGPSHDVCPETCCLPASRHSSPTAVPPG